MPLWMWYSASSATSLRIPSSISKCLITSWNFPFCKWEIQKYNRFRYRSEGNPNRIQCLNKWWLRFCPMIQFFSPFLLYPMILITRLFTGTDDKYFLAIEPQKYRILWGWLSSSKVPFICPNCSNLSSNAGSGRRPFDLVHSLAI